MFSEGARAGRRQARATPRDLTILRAAQRRKHPEELPASEMYAPTSISSSSLTSYILDEYVVFITPTQLQRDIFHQILTADKLDTLVRNSTAESLALIGMLTKVSNSPILLKAAADKAREKSQKDAEGELIKKDVFAEAARLLPERAQVEDVSLSGWFPVIDKERMLTNTDRETDCAGEPSTCGAQGQYMTCSTC